MLSWAPSATPPPVTDSDYRAHEQASERASKQGGTPENALAFGQQAIYITQLLCAAGLSSSSFLFIKPSLAHLKAGDVGAEEGRELAAAPRSLALVAELVVQHVRLHLDLQVKRNIEMCASRDKANSMPLSYLPSCLSLRAAAGRTWR